MVISQETLKSRTLSDAFYRSVKARRDSKAATSFMAEEAAREEEWSEERRMFEKLVKMSACCR